MLLPLCQYALGGVALLISYIATESHARGSLVVIAAVSQDDGM